jgi:hypothetical protein
LPNSRWYSLNHIREIFEHCRAKIMQLRRSLREMYDSLSNDQKTSLGTNAYFHAAAQQSLNWIVKLPLLKEREPLI